MALHESWWSYERFRWMKLAAATLVVAGVAYVAGDPPRERGGDTVVGYTLGVACAILMLWLAWFGVRKRSYHSAGAPLRGWLSAHVWLGLALVALVPLHSAFEFGANVHTAAGVLVLAVVASGIVGVAFYASVPARMTENRPGGKLESVLERIAELDGECRAIAEALPDAFASAVRVAIEETRLGGGVLRQLSGRDPSCGTGRALAAVAREAARVEGRERAEVQRLLEVLSVKRSLVAKVRHDIRDKALLEAWLVLHVPLAIASLVAVAAHVVVVFLYR